MWMHGAAGAGKSAIMQSIAELCEQAQIPLASFFFFRTDDTRNSLNSFVATLVYQLIQGIPQVQDDILGVIESHPLIFDQSLQSQIEKLIIQPILRLQKQFKSSRTTPVIFLVASRREPQIEAAFVRKEVSRVVLTLPLDNSDVEQTSEDIRLDWPAASIVEEIVVKSSGQFIFASVVINYLSSPRANPATQLDIIRGIRLRGPSSLNPFAHLDALYQHIFSQVEVLDKVFDIIGYVLSGGYHGIEHMERIFLLEVGEIDSLFADLTAVIWCEPRTRSTARMKFLHASLPDFLSDRSRSERYHIDVDEYRTRLLCTFLERCPPTLDPLWSSDNLMHAIDREGSRLYAIMYLLEKQKASERLSRAFMNFNCKFYAETFLDGWSEICTDTLRILKGLRFGDRGKVYRHVVGVFAEECARYWPLINDTVKCEIESESPDLYAVCNT
ncbi:hypothetical protein BJ912DRAFT_951416 [Pholiota molesta]|nr:hypothetical protein BJ912DRAFT_951416 [Pholiota molesta]